MKRFCCAGLALAVALVLGLGGISELLRAEDAAEEAPVSQSDLLLESFGCASAVALYNVQMVIGLTADAYPKDVHSAEQMNTILEEQKNMLQVVDCYLEKLRNLQPPLPESEQASLQLLTDCVATLRETAEALTTYITTPTDDAAKDFETKRQASYAAVADLLGLEDE